MFSANSMVHGLPWHEKRHNPALPPTKDSFWSNSDVKNTVCQKWKIVQFRFLFLFLKKPMQNLGMLNSFICFFLFFLLFITFFSSTSFFHCPLFSFSCLFSLILTELGSAVLQTFWTSCRVAYWNINWRLKGTNIFGFVNFEFRSFR